MRLLFLCSVLFERFVPKTCYNSARKLSKILLRKIQNMVIFGYFSPKYIKNRFIFKWELTVTK